MVYQRLRRLPLRQSLCVDAEERGVLVSTAASACSNGDRGAPPREFTGFRG